MKATSPIPAIDLPSKASSSMESPPPPHSPDLSPTPSPYITAPSSPKYFSDFSADDPPDADIQIPNFTIPPNREDKPEGKSSRSSFEEDDDITFEFCVDQFHSFSLPAEELFDGGKIRPLKPPPAAQLGGAEFSGSASPSIGGAASQIRRPVIIWPSRRSYDFDSFETTLERGETASFGGSKTGRFSRLRNLLSFRRSSVSERASCGSKASMSFGSSGSSSSGSGPRVRSVSGSGRDPDDVAKKSLTPCKQRLLSCFVKRL